MASAAAQQPPQPPQPQGAQTDAQATATPPATPVTALEGKSKTFVATPTLDTRGTGGAMMSDEAADDAKKQAQVTALHGPDGTGPERSVKMGAVAGADAGAGAGAGAGAAAGAVAGAGAGGMGAGGGPGRGGGGVYGLDDDPPSDFVANAQHQFKNIHDPKFVFEANTAM